MKLLSTLSSAGVTRCYLIRNFGSVLCVYVFVKRVAVLRIAVCMCWALQSIIDVGRHITFNRFNL